MQRRSKLMVPEHMVVARVIAWRRPIPCSTVGLRDHDYRLPAQPKRREGTIAVGPVLQDRRELRRLALQQIPEQQQPSGSRPGGAWAARRARHGGDRVWV